MRRPLKYNACFLLSCAFSALSAVVICKEEKIVFDTGHQGLIAAFGDFDSDRFTDIFFIGDAGKSLKLLKSYEKEPELREWPKIGCFFNDTSHVIAGVIPADFNGDAAMDVLVITNHHENARKFFIWFCKGDRVNLDCDLSKPLLDNSRSHPLVLDYNGDMIADFIIETDDCQRELWTYSSKKFKKDCPLFLRPSKEASQMRYPNSNAFVNIQNCRQQALDYTTDIFISGEKQMEYWFDAGGFNQENVVYISYPDPDRYIVGQSAFIDLNIDGCIEHIIAACEKVPHLEKCDPQILWYNNEKHEWTKISNFNDLSNQTNYYFEEIQTTYGYSLPITVRSGDVDGDGFVDLVTVMKSYIDQKKKAVILKNIRDDSLPRKRKFVIYWTSDQYIDEDVELVSFLDVQENGRPDVVMTTRDSKGQYNIKWIRNTFMESNCFLKVLVTSGLCHGVCPNERVPYGTNQAGPFICYETSDVNGLLIKGCSAQLSQSSHFALQMPYSIFGLGETPNFVETVTASIPSGEIRPARKSRWTQIVPDAQVVLIPYPPNETAYWISKLFYTPSSIVFSTLGTLAILCLVLILIISILHRKEVLEDLAEHQEYKRHWPESR